MVLEELDKVMFPEKMYLVWNLLVLFITGIQNTLNPDLDMH